MSIIHFITSKPEKYSVPSLHMSRQIRKLTKVSTTGLQSIERTLSLGQGAQHYVLYRPPISVHHMANDLADETEPVHGLRNVGWVLAGRRLFISCQQMYDRGDDRSYRHAPGSTFKSKAAVTQVCILFGALLTLLETLLALCGFSMRAVQSFLAGLCYASISMLDRGQVRSRSW